MKDDKTIHKSDEFKECVQDGIKAYNEIQSYYNKYLSEKCTKEINRGEDEDERE